MVLKGQSNTTPEMPPIIIPQLQNRSVISVIKHFEYSIALTSSGKLLTWGEYHMGSLGLGDPGKLPAGFPGGYEREEDKKYKGSPPNVTVPSEVRFDHGLKTKGRVKRYCFAATIACYRAAALVIDSVEDEALLEEKKRKKKNRGSARGSKKVP